jgi:hypothetical protein
LIRDCAVADNVLADDSRAVDSMVPIRTQQAGDSP